MNDTVILKKLMEQYGEQILPIDVFPKAYCPGGISNVKAIYLGCDPSNKHSTNLPFAFAHESDLKIFNSFIKTHTEQLMQIKLNWNDVYAQNLCRNYFRDETSKNIIWKTVAKEFWIDKLKDELVQFDAEIPILLTSSYLYDVLVTCKKNKPIEFYECRQEIPIPSEDNKLSRPLIPFYRNRRKVDYHLSNERWCTYKETIINNLNL